MTCSNTHTHTELATHEHDLHAVQPPRVEGNAHPAPCNALLSTAWHQGVAPKGLAAWTYILVTLHSSLKVALGNLEVALFVSPYIVVFHDCKLGAELLELPGE